MRGHTCRPAISLIGLFLWTCQTQPVATSDLDTPVLAQCVPNCDGGGTNPYGPIDPYVAVLSVSLTGPSDLRVNPQPWTFTASASGGRTSTYIYEWYLGTCSQGCSGSPPPPVFPNPVQSGTSNTYTPRAADIPSSIERIRVTVRVHESKVPNYYSGTATRGALGPAFSKGAGEIINPNLCTVGNFLDEYDWIRADSIKHYSYQRNYCTGYKQYADSTPHP
jgi:hypothetical protein